MIKPQRITLFVGDVGILMLSFIIMTVLRFTVHGNRIYILTQAHIFIGLFTLWLIVFFIFDLYNLRRVNPTPRSIGLLISAIVVSMGLSVLFFYLFPSNGTPKTNLLIVGIIALLLLAVWRRIFYHIFTVHFGRSVAIVGTSPLIAHLAQELKNNTHFGKLTIHWETLPTQQELTENNRTIHLLVSESSDPQILLALATILKAELLSLNEAYETLFAKIPLSLMTHDKAMEVMTKNTPNGLEFLYRFFEIFIAIIVLIATSPFLLIAIIARLIEDGFPIFYSQKRVGKNGKIFSVYKIRSMTKNAEKNGAQWADKKDSRITCTGNILRKTHIDEIPQMFNVIKGDIALVGPRPERPEFVAELEKQIPYYFLRHTIRPGFTGWAQIKYRYARSIDDSQEKFEYDLYYLKNRNPLLDVGIVLKTLQIIFTH